MNLFNVEVYIGTVAGQKQDAHMRFIAFQCPRQFTITFGGCRYARWDEPNLSFTATGDVLAAMHSAPFDVAQ